MTVKDLAKRWNVSRSWVYRRIHRDDLPYYRATERTIRIDGFEAELWLANHHNGEQSKKRKWKL